MEVYSPPYLFNSNGTAATRPSITSLTTAKIGYGAAFQVKTPDAANIASVVLMRNGAVTHAFNMDQRYVGLSYTVGSGVLNVTGPPTGNIAPPGYYMLFILNDAGVPSMASVVQVTSSPGNQPPDGTITSPSTDQTITVGQSVTYAGTGTDSDGSISAYSSSFPGGSPSSSNLANPGAVTYTTAGTYVTSLTVTDNQGATDPIPPTRTITVKGAPAFSLGVSPFSQSVLPGGSANYTVTASGDTGFSGNIAFSVSGVPAGASASFNPTSVTNSGSSTLTISTTGATAVGDYLLTVTAVSGSTSRSSNISLVVAPNSGASAINFGSGFSATGMQFNGHTKLNGTRLQLTDTSTGSEVASAFWTTKVNVASFTSDFLFQETNAIADGFTFTMQGNAATAIGPLGSGLGYGGSQVASPTASQLNSTFTTTPGRE